MDKDLYTPFPADDAHFALIANAYNNRANDLQERLNKYEDVNGVPKNKLWSVYYTQDTGVDYRNKTAIIIAETKEDAMTKFNSYSINHSEYDTFILKDRIIIKELRPDEDDIIFVTDSK